MITAPGCRPARVCESLVPLPSNFLLNFLDQYSLWSSFLHKRGTVTFVQQRLKPHICANGGEETVSTSARYRELAEKERYYGAFSAPSKVHLSY